MRLILIYVKETFIELLPVIPIVILIRIAAILLLRKKGFKTAIHHEIGTSIFTYYLIALFSVTINYLGLLSGSISFGGNINLIPFKEINIILQSGDFNYIFINIVGNILLFSPIGFFLPLLWKKTKSIVSVVVIGFMVSLFIEFMQLFSYRGTDIDDLILNTVGTFVGYIIFRLYYRIFHKFADKFIID